MREVAVVGVGMTPVGEHWNVGFRDLAGDAVRAALTESNVAGIDALVIGNALGGTISGQNHVAPLIADYVGMRGIEAVHVEGADASGGLAFRYGCLMIASGAADTVMVLGVEKVTDVVGSGRGKALATMLDSEYEAAHGATPVGVAALLMRRYLHEYKVNLTGFANFSVNAHANGGKNPLAMYKNQIKAERFAAAPVVAEPINLFDVAPDADGAAAVILTTAERAADLTANPIRVLASAVGTDALAVHERTDPLFLTAVKQSADRAFRQANLTPDEISFAEIHDAATILSTLALEASGFAGRGEGWKLAAEGAIMPAGTLPISTFGGLKSRGNPIGRKNCDW